MSRHYLQSSPHLFQENQIGKACLKTFDSLCLHPHGASAAAFRELQQIETPVGLGLEAADFNVCKILRLQFNLRSQID